MSEKYVIGEGMYEDAEQWEKLPDGRIVPRGYGGYDGTPGGLERPHGACAFLVFLGLLATSCFVGYAVWMTGLSLAIFGR